jgi:hypothetical protein
MAPQPTKRLVRGCRFPLHPMGHPVVCGARDDAPGLSRSGISGSSIGDQARQRDSHVSWVDPVGGAYVATVPMHRLVIRRKSG